MQQQSVKEKIAKVVMSQPEVATCFSPKDLRIIEGLVVNHHQELQEKWDGYFNTNR